MNASVLLIVGLGNPGEAYERTRHNVGFEVVERLGEALPGSPVAVSCRGGLLERIDLPGTGEGARTVLLLRPQLYMNRSGAPAAEVRDRFAIDPSLVLAVFDDLDLPLGALRMRRGGGHGGHNGVRDLITHLRPAQEPSLAGEPPVDFPRLRLGIGRPTEGESAEDHVLGRFSPEERTSVEGMIGAACRAVVSWIESGLDPAIEIANATRPEAVEREGASGRS
jgi:PTH1 family peptidyl-tRNA hydrolase